MDGMEFGVISDTHGILKPEALEALKGCGLIVHAGDIGGPEIVEVLEKIAPVTAVRGNMDYGQWVFRLKKFETVELESKSVYVLHNLLDLEFDPSEAGFRMVIHGHTHRPKIERKNGVIYLNPGTSGPHRHADSGSIARCRVSGEDISCEIVELKYGPS